VSEASRAAASAAARPQQAWTTLLGLYMVTSFVESFGISQIFAFLPLQLAHLGVAPADIGRQVGILSSLVFILGLPLVPLWGVWADKYSRKTIIIRSAVVEAVVFAGVALSQTPWQLALSLLLVGFQLGNTGVMLAALRDVTPRHRLGTAVGLFSASSPVGFAVGPIMGGLMLDGLHLEIWTLYALDAVLSIAVALMLAVGSREVRPSVVPTGSVLSLAWGAIRGALTDRAVLWIFAVFGLALLARQMVNPFLPVLVAEVNGPAGVAAAIGLVVGVAALVGALFSPLAGALGDRVGFRRVLAASLLGGAAAAIGLTLARGLPALALASVAVAAFGAAVTSMVYTLLAVEVAPERRSATLNLALLPLYAAGIIGPAIGAVVVGVGLDLVFLVAAALLASAAVFVLLRMRLAPAPAHH